MPYAESNGRGWVDKGGGARMSDITVAKMRHRILQCFYVGYDFKSVEMAPYHSDVRFDIIGINRYNRNVKIFEIKSCRHDFIKDKKWQKYLPFCTQMYFAAPKGVIKAEELPAGVGLVEFYNQPVNGYMLYDFTKRCRTREPVSQDNYIKLIEGAMVRLDTENKKLKDIIAGDYRPADCDVWDL